MIYNELLLPEDIASLRTLVDAGEIQFIKFRGRSESGLYVASKDGYFFGLGNGAVVQVKVSRGHYQPYQERLEARRRVPKFDPTARAMLRKSTEIPLLGFGPFVDEVVLFRGEVSTSDQNKFHFDARIEIKDKKGACIYVFLASLDEDGTDVLCLSLSPDFEGGYYGENYFVLQRELSATEGALNLEPMLSTDIASGLAPCLGQGQFDNQADEFLC